MISSTIRRDSALQAACDGSIARATTASYNSYLVILGILEPDLWKRAVALTVWVKAADVSAIAVLMLPLLNRALAVVVTIGVM